MPATWDEMRTFGLSFPHTAQSTCDGVPDVSDHGHSFLRFRRDDDTVLIVTTPWERRALLESRDPAMCTVSHDDQDTVLLRLEQAELDNEVEEIITEAWRIAEIYAKQVKTQ